MNTDDFAARFPGESDTNYIEALRSMLAAEEAYSSRLSSRLDESQAASQARYDQVQELSAQVSSLKAAMGEIVEVSDVAHIIEETTHDVAEFFGEEADARDFAIAMRQQFGSDSFNFRVSYCPEEIREMERRDVEDREASQASQDVMEESQRILDQIRELGLI